MPSIRRAMSPRALQARRMNSLQPTGLRRRAGKHRSALNNWQGSRLAVAATAGRNCCAMPAARRSRK